MTSFQVVIFVTAVAAALAHSEHSDHSDIVALLQTQVEELSKKSSDVPDLEEASDYKLTDSLNCASEMPASYPTEPALVVKQSTAVAASNPPGADVLKAVLQLMAGILLSNCVRRWYLQKQGQQKLRATDDSSETAWVDMVKAATSADLTSFDKALQGNPQMMQTDTWGCTPLHFAAMGGSVAIVSKLLKHGVDIDAVDANNETPLHVAARAGHSSVCELLFEAGAKAGGSGMADGELPPFAISQVVQKVFATGPATVFADTEDEVEAEAEADSEAEAMFEAEA